MPFVRCRFYTESGGPVRGGCRRKGAGCAFVHPGDSNWINAPPPSTKARHKSGDSGSSKPWGERGKGGAVDPSAWATGGNASTSTADTGGGWDTGSGWDTGGGWGTGGGWDMGGSTSTPNRVPEPAEPNNPPTAKSRDTSALVNERSQVGATPSASGSTKSSEDGWGGSVDKATGSAWGSNENVGWGTSSWGENKDADKNAGSTGSSALNDGWGAGWGDNKSAGSTWGSAGSGWGDSKDATNSWGASDPMIVDNQVGKKTEQNKGKGRVVVAPPRIRIPDNENKKVKISGTNNEPLGTSKWGESRSSNLLTTSTPLTASTPGATLTPIDSSRVKRKRDAGFDDKIDVLKEYVKTWERGVRARFLLAEAEAKRDRWFRTQKSACYARIGEAGRKKLDGQRAECDNEVNSQKEKLSGAITSLVKFYDTISSNLDLGQHYNISEESNNFITESKAFVDEVRALLVERVLRDKNSEQSGDNQQQPSSADAASINSLRCRVQDLEERFEQARTELTLRHQRDIYSEINALLTAKITDLRVARQHEIDRVASHPPPEIVIPPGALKNTEGMTQQVRELDVKVLHAVEDIRVLLLRVDATTKRVSKLEEELSLNKDTYRKMQETAAEKETEQKVVKRLVKIQEQYEQLVASQLPSPATQRPMLPTTHNSRDKLMESLQPAFEALLEKFYEQQVQPTIISLQQDVIEASDHHQEEAIKVLWGKIQPAMNMVAGVSRWLDSQELSLTAPVEDNL